MRIIILALAAWLGATASAIAAQRPQVIPEPMLLNVFALTQASATLQICAESSAYPSVPDSRKALLARLQQRIDGLVRTIASKFDDDLFEFFSAERDKMARDPDQIALVRKTYAYCDQKLFDRMQWYVYDSRQKLEQFLSELPPSRK